MFLDDRLWPFVTKDPDHIRAFTDRLKELLKAEGDPREQDFALNSSDDARLQIIEVRQRKMLCYPDWVLYKLRIDLDKFGRGSGYAEGAVYALIDAPFESLQLATHAVLLNGTSPVIHSLNASSWGKQGKSPLQLGSAEEYIEYLLFFCTFVAGEEGPFLIVESLDDLLSLSGNVDFKELMAERRLDFKWSNPGEPIPREALQRFLSTPVAQREETLEDLKAVVPKPQPATREKLTPKDRLRGIAGQIKDWNVKPSPPKEPDKRFCVEGYLLYGRHLFKSEFAMDQSGMIEMLGDEPVGTDLPIRVYRFDPQLPVLLVQGQRQEMRGKDFEKELFDTVSASKAEPIRNGLIIGDVNLKGRKFEKTIHLDDVWITGDVILDDLRTEFSIQFADVRIGGRLHAKNLRCDGALSLRKAEVHGYYDRSKFELSETRKAPPEDHVALNLRGAHLTSELDLTRAWVQGGADLDDIEVVGTARLSGIHVTRREPLSYEPHGLTLRRAHFKRGLDIGPDMGRSTLLDPRPALVVGGLDWTGITVSGDLNLNLLQSIEDYYTVKMEDLKSAISSTADGLGYWDEHGTKFRWLMSQEGNINLASARIGGNVYMQGATAGGFFLTGGTVDGMLDGNPHKSPGIWQPTRIRGDVILSGATVGSDTRFCSAEIDGLLQVITGSLKRVQLRPEFSPQTDECVQTKVGGILIQTADVDALDFYALRVVGTDENEHSGAVTLFGVTVRGDFVLFRDAPDTYLLHDLHNPERSERKKHLPDLCKLRPEIARKLKARSLTVAGEINLTNLWVGTDKDGGDIDLEGTICGKLTALARISKTAASRYDAIRAAGANIKTEQHPLLKAGSLNLSRLQCTGDVDLSGVLIEKSVEARAAQVAGTLAFYHSENTEDGANEKKRDVIEELPARIGENLDLGLTRASTLKISGQTFIDGGKSRKGALKLDRAEVGDLTLIGPEPYPYYADLQDLKLAQLSTPDKLDRDLRQSFVRELLRTSWPFDRGIYRTIEHSLRDEGNDTHANEIYRQMRWRVLRPQFKPRKSPVWDIIFRMFYLLVSIIPDVITSIKRALLDLGHGRVAQALYSSSFGLLGRLFRWLFTLGEAVVIGLLTGFWTQGYRFLVLVLLITLPISWFAFSVRANIEPTTAQLGETGKGNPKDLTRSDWPDPDQWSLDERVRLLAATHIPIISLIDGARWEPAENRNLCLPDSVRIQTLAGSPDQQSTCPKGTWALLNWTPAVYGLIVRALHWIAWPLFLIGMSGIIQRTGRQ